MRLGTIQLGHVAVSRLILGGNPFSGFSHQGEGRDREMARWYTTARIKEALRQAEQVGVTTHLSRADRHVMRYMLEHWDEGGRLTWLAQTCPELGPCLKGVESAIAGGAKACHIHGGVVDFLFANGQLDELPPAIARLRAAGLSAGIAAHNPKVFEWAEKNLDCDYYLCCYYNSANRDKRAEHVPGMVECFHPDDRRVMTDLIQTLRRPVVHYKVLAAGRNDPAEAFDVVARALRPQDAVCIGVHTQDNAAMLADDIRLLEAALIRHQKLPTTNG
jgi:hypothetical protein